MRGLNTPPEILLEIERGYRARLEQLQTELAEVKSGSEPASQPTDLTYLHEQLALYQSAQLWRLRRSVSNSKSMS
ncbi:MAG: hypothetical protein HS126_40090 [Anaerolineales bacterium]|nr:hypothetical protein [Anaerolineales bacterium]